LSCSHKEFEDFLHLLIVFELVAFRDRCKAGAPVFAPSGKVGVEVVGGALELHGDKSCFWKMVSQCCLIFFQKFCSQSTNLVKVKLQSLFPAEQRGVSLIPD